MPGQKCRGREGEPARTRASASSIDGLIAAKPAVNSANSVEPIPTMTASARTLTPEAITLPSTRSAGKRRLAEKAERNQHETRSVVSLNSMSVTKS